jgi:hypothetical protein
MKSPSGKKGQQDILGKLLWLSVFRRRLNVFDEKGMGSQVNSTKRIPKHADFWIQLVVFAKGNALMTIMTY